MVKYFFPNVYGGGGRVREERGGEKVHWRERVQGRKGRKIWALTVQKDRGRKKMLTKAKSLTFSPSLVDALLSITALALNSCEKKKSQHQPSPSACKNANRPGTKNLRHLSKPLLTPVSA